MNHLVEILNILKTEAEKLDTNKSMSVPVDLSKLSDVVKNNAFKETTYNKLVAHVNSIDTSGLLKRQITMLKSLTQRVKYQA